MKKQSKIPGTRLKRGDVFNTHMTGLFVVHERPPRGRKLHIVPLDMLHAKKVGTCDFFHDPATWKLKGVRAIYNIYDSK